MSGVTGLILMRHSPPKKKREVRTGQPQRRAERQQRLRRRLQLGRESLTFAQLGEHHLERSQAGKERDCVEGVNRQRFVERRRIDDLPHSGKKHRVEWTPISVNGGSPMACEVVITQVEVAHSVGFTK
jgi:hypothetical protein